MWRKRPHALWGLGLLPILPSHWRRLQLDRECLLLLRRIRAMGWWHHEAGHSWHSPWTKVEVKYRASLSLQVVFHLFRIEVKAAATLKRWAQSRGGTVRKDCWSQRQGRGERHIKQAPTSCKRRDGKRTVGICIHPRHWEYWKHEFRFMLLKAVGARANCVSRGHQVCAAAPF